jgi:hypothetical protein
LLKTLTRAPITENISVVTGIAAGNVKRTVVDGLNGFGATDTIRNDPGVFAVSIPVTASTYTSISVGLFDASDKTVTVQVSKSTGGVTHTTILVVSPGRSVCAVVDVSILNGVELQPLIEPIWRVVPPTLTRVIVSHALENTNGSGKANRVGALWNS